ncbi:exoenzyme S synthesis protein B [Carboxylicivirga caseinilyticus]|uniref:exoenzyme S synthesis protein B n=1 Tax=Carboxylicivirga caseinilyticus TaxID=3417572 RepID=UPI003D343484|nr:exoenzyme S synthesis protein B [Marinilabiliaceae bacterium A049]
MTKADQLIQWFKQNTEGYLLFSGGFDSSAVLGAAMKANSNIIPVWVDNGFNRASVDSIKVQARNLGSTNLQIYKIKPSETVKENPVKRCYFCKSSILAQIPKDALAIYDGTTASDLGNFRPGKIALDEYGVRSPLAELDITSSETKDIAIEFGADPLLANLESCLATRINYKHFLYPERISVIKEIEKFVIDKTNDFDVRCRFDDDEHIRIEFSKAESYLALADTEFREHLFDLGKEAALFITIDIKRSRPNEYDKRINKVKKAYV